MADGARSPPKRGTFAASRQRAPVARLYRRRVGPAAVVPRNACEFQVRRPFARTLRARFSFWVHFFFVFPRTFLFVRPIDSETVYRFRIYRINISIAEPVARSSVGLCANVRKSRTDTGAGIIVNKIFVRSRKKKPNFLSFFFFFLRYRENPIKKRLSDRFWDSRGNRRSRSPMADRQVTWYAATMSAIIISVAAGIGEWLILKYISPLKSHYRLDLWIKKKKTRSHRWKSSEFTTIIIGIEGFKRRTNIM